MSNKINKIIQKRKAKQDPKFFKLSESSFQKKVLDYMKLSSYVFKVMKANRSGVLDVCACKQGKFISVEVKREDGVLSELQKVHIQEVKENKGLTFVVKPSSFEEFKVWFDSIS